MSAAQGTPLTDARNVDRVKELREQIDRNPLAFACQAERLERERAELLAITMQLIACLDRLSSGGAFDLTDSPKSFMATVQRLTAEARAAIARAEVAK